MGLFDGYATPVDEIPTGFGLPNGEYEVLITDVKKVKAKDSDKVSLVTELTVQEGPLNGRKHTEWKTIPGTDGQQHIDVQASVLKGWLKAIGVPDGMMGEFDPDDEDHKDSVIGLDGVLSIVPQKKKPEYSNAYFKLNTETKESGVSDAKPGEPDPAYDPTAFGLG